MATPEMLAIGRNLPITVQRIAQEDPNRYSAKIVGYVHMRYLVIGDLENLNLEVSEPLLIRMLSEGEAVAYQVTVKKANSDPVLFMTTFPEKVESVSLRASERIKAFFPAEVRHTSETAFKNLLSESAAPSREFSEWALDRPPPSLGWLRGNIWPADSGCRPCRFRKKKK